MESQLFQYCLVVRLQFYVKHILLISLPFLKSEQRLFSWVRRFVYSFQILIPDAFLEQLAHEFDDLQRPEEVTVKVISFVLFICLSRPYFQGCFTILSYECFTSQANRVRLTVFVCEIEIIFSFIGSSFILNIHFLICNCNSSILYGKTFYVVAFWVIMHQF